MNKTKALSFLAAAAIALPALAQQSAPSKVGIIHIQNAIISTKDGQKAAAELQGKFEPKRKDLESRQSEIASLQQKLAQGSNTMAETARLTLTRDIDQKTKALNRATEDAEAEFQQEQGKILNELGQRLLQVIDKYARDNGYTLILDVSSPQTPVLYAATGTDVTKDIIELYDKNAPSANMAPASGAAAKPATPPPAAPSAKPAVTPAVPAAKKPAGAK